MRRSEILTAFAASDRMIAAWIGNRLAGTWPAGLRLIVMSAGLIGGTLFISGGLYSILIRDILRWTDAYFAH